jgi:4-diphosphocytidyl-2-C-methyl-D-erythritol kinase
LSAPEPSTPNRTLRCHAPAKINLGLRIVGSRPDGYHELESLFVPLDLGDEVEVEVAPASDLEVKIEVAGMADGVPADSDNLAHRAASRFAQRAGLRCQIRLRILKRIPSGAGMGGGSSDAGAVLRALREFFPSALKESLAHLALELGADVPFFLDPRPARVTGIGEQIEPLEGLSGISVLLVNPGISLSTADVFRTYDAVVPALTKPAAGRTILPRSGAAGSDWDFAAAGKIDLQNDLEPIAIRLCPPVARLLARLAAVGARAAGMSGSGPTVFGLFESKAGAEAGLKGAGFEAPIWARVATTLESR